MKADNDQLSASVNTKHDVSTRSDFGHRQNDDVNFWNVRYVDDSILAQPSELSVAESDDNVIVVAFVAKQLGLRHQFIDIFRRTVDHDVVSGLQNRVFEFCEFREIVGWQTLVHAPQVDAGQTIDLKWGTNEIQSWNNLLLSA